MGSEIYGFTEDTTLVSFVPKPSKAVVLISSMHHTEQQDEETKKLEIIAYYNMTEGVHTIDQKTSNYMCCRKTRRLTIFFRMIDVSCAVNPYILHQTFSNRTLMSRLKFIITLAKELIHPLLEKRIATVKNLLRELLNTTRRILGVEEAQPAANQ